ncbi:MAG: TadG family pilus assembly protein [Desulfosoma sp.]
MNDDRRHFEEYRAGTGSVAVIVAVCIAMLIGFGALAVDIGHLFMAKNELQNAADAGALAGARVLYNDNGTINAGANQVAYDTATANKSEKQPVEVIAGLDSNTGDIQRGHWNPLTRTFTPNASLDPPDLSDRTDEEIHNDVNVIDAVRVRTRREATPIVAFLARIFGYEGFTLSAEAVAWCGPPGPLPAESVNQIIAICAQSIKVNDRYSCNIGRMINSGSQQSSHNTAGWTDFLQNEECNGVNANDLKALLQGCKPTNKTPIYLGKDMETGGGADASVFKAFRDCWIAASDNRTKPWKLALPVIDCPSNNVANCSEVRGAVYVDVVWVTDVGEDPKYKDAPRKMAGVPPYYSAFDNSTVEDGKTRWNNFVNHFDLKNVDNQPAPYDKMSIYFLPDCTVNEPIGGTGTEYFGVKAKIPVLVK